MTGFLTERYLSMSREIKGPIRVLHAPTTVGGNPQGLSTALKRLGCQSHSMTLFQNYFQYPADVVIWSERDGILKREYKRLFAILREISNYDIIHFNFGTTIAYPYACPSLGECLSSLTKSSHLLRALYLNALQLFELQMLKHANIPMFVTYQGDDARQGDYCLAHFDISIAAQVDSDYYNAQTDNFKRRSIKRLVKYCEQIYSVNPDLLHVLPDRAKFVPYSNILLEEWSPCYTQQENRPLRILHAPSHRKAKGTDLILAALDNLRAKGFKFEFVMVEGVNNTEARKLYRKADILIDQLFAGWYGGLAVELMALGKPVIVYIREDDLRYIPVQMAAELPFLKATPDSIEDCLRRVLTMPRDELVSLARRSRVFVERWHDTMKIAAAIKADYETALRKRGRLTE
jgi:glycosyltransferase involved in cell wall biosynthesis